MNPAAQAPVRIGRYQLVRELGRGSFAVVHEALAGPEGPAVALKVLHPRVLLLQPDALERLRRELAAARAVDHPGVVRPLDAGVDGGTPFVAFELVRGARPITHAFVGRSQLERVALVRDAARALGAAHTRGIVHRDVKASNVLVDEAGRVRVTDFGLAWAPGQAPLTVTGVSLGTPAAMAPEVTVEGSRRSTSPRVDVWGLGLLLFEALAGAPPFGEGGALGRHVRLGPEAPPPGPRDVDPHTPPALDVVCRRALAPRPEERFADGDALADALDGLLAAARPRSLSRTTIDHAAVLPAPRPSAILRRVVGPGTRLGRYALMERIGAGGMGQVYRARDEALDREVAIKVLHGGGEERQRRFVREQQAAARVQHPGVVAVHDAGEFEGFSWLAMDLVEGESLEEVLRRGPLPPADGARLVARCARAVDALHAAGILHRDLKPGNVLIGHDGAPRVTDFGVARLDDAERLTRTGQALGTPMYMAPEQLVGDRDVDGRADVYALGVLLFEVLTGRPPWDAESMMGLASAKATAPPSPAPLRRGIPRALARVCVQAMAPQPQDRPPTAAALADAIEAALGAGDDGASPRRRLALVGAAVALAAGLGATAYATRGAGEGAAAAPVDWRSRVEAAVAAAPRLAAVELGDDLVAAAADARPSSRGRGLLALARGERAAAAAALDALPAADSPAARALQGGLAALGDGAPADALAALDASGLRQPEVEAWRLRALARQGVDRAEASRRLLTLTALRARGGPLAEAAAHLEVACLTALDRGEEAAAALGRLADPPAELTWDLRLLAALAAAAAGRWEEAVGALGDQRRLAGPLRPRELELAGRVLARLEAIVAERGPTMDTLKPPQLVALTPMLELHPRVAPGRPLPDELAGPATLLIARSALLGGMTPRQSTRLFLATSEAWPDHGVAQEDSVGPLYLVRVNDAHLLQLDEAGQEGRIAEAARRALGVHHPVRRAMAWTLRLASLVNLDRLAEAQEVADELPSVLEAAARADPRAIQSIRSTNELLRARLAVRRGQPEAALDQLDAIEGAGHDPVEVALVRHEALAAAGREAERVRLLLEVAGRPLDRGTRASRAVAERAWAALRLAARWEDAERVLRASGTVGAHPEDVGLRLAHVLVRRGRPDVAAGVLDDNREWLARRGLADLAAGVRAGDPRALERLDALTRAE
ncbi:MAG: protein kinase [Planctomycetes bacterium]|nr:protein kinase [Planctomycetota bacterium]